jgi:hypothetical protein
LEKLLKGHGVGIFYVWDNQGACSVFAKVVDGNAKIYMLMDSSVGRTFNGIIGGIDPREIAEGAYDCPADYMCKGNLTAAAGIEVFIDNPAVFFQKSDRDRPIGGSGGDGETRFHVFHNAEVPASNGFDSCQGFGWGVSRKIEF